MNKLRPLSVAIALTLSVALAACGAQTEDRSQTSAATQHSGFPVTVAAANGAVTLEKQPRRIVSLSPSATESLFAIGAGEQVVAVDEYSTYPKNAPRTKLSGFEPNVEAIAGYDPDLVVVAGDSNGVVGALTKLHVPVIVSPAPASIDAGYDGLAELGQATGHIDETAALIADMRGRIKRELASAPKAGVRVYHELDDKYYSASSKSFIGSVYSAVGAINIADAADKNGTGYPQLTAEAIIDADPQLIVITDQVSYTAADVAERPGWSGVSAVKDGNIVTLDADISSRWGPRLPQLVQAVVDALASVKTAVG